MSKVIVTVKHTIPLMDYGNTTIEATLEIDTTDLNELNVAEDTLNDVQHSLALCILPLVNSEVERCMSVLTQDSEPDKWMRKNSKVYQWFRLAYPDFEIPAMNKIEKTIFENKNPEFKNRGAASLKEFDRGDLDAYKEMP